MNKVINKLSLIWLLIIYIVLFAPILIVILMSFNTSQYGMFPIHFTLKWYELLFSESNLFHATGLSIMLSIWVSLTAVIIGTLAAIGMRSMNKKILGMLTMLLNATVIIPWIVLSTAMLILFNAVGIGRSYAGMFLGNLTIVIPYVALPVFSRLCGSETFAEDAARTLGANSFRIMWNIILPDIFPSILSGGLFAFIICFNNFVVQYYLAPFGVRTLPLEIYNMVRVGCEPDMNALMALIILSLVVIVFLIYRFGGYILHTMPDLNVNKVRQKSNEKASCN